MVPFLNATDALAASLESAPTATDVRPIGCLHLEEDEINRWLTRIRTSLNYGTTVSTVAVLGQYALIAAGVLTTPILPATILGLGLFGVFHGWRAATQAELKAAKLELSRKLAELVRQVSRWFFEVDLASGRFSRVDEYFQTLEGTLAKQVSTIAAQKLAETQAEIDRLDEEARLSDEQRQARAEQIRKQAAEWDGLGQEIKVIQFELRELERTAASKVATST